MVFLHDVGLEWHFLSFIVLFQLARQIKNKERTGKGLGRCSLFHVVRKQIE